MCILLSPSLYATVDCDSGGRGHTVADVLLGLGAVQPLRRGGEGAQGLQERQEVREEHLLLVAF